MHPLALLAVLRHERRLGHAMQRPGDRAEHAGRKQDALVDREDRDEVQGRADASPMMNDHFRPMRSEMSPAGTEKAAPAMPPSRRRRPMNSIGRPTARK